MCLWGAQRDIGAGLSGLPALKKRLSDYLYGFHVVAGFAITEARALEALDWVEANGPTAVYGFTSLLDFMARVALDHGRKIPKGLVSVAWNGGECLFSEQSQRFESVFGVPIQNYYAGRELGALGCQTSPDDPLEIPRPHIFLELVDEQGDPVPPGTDGRVIVTSTVCRGTPFLRYEVGDMGSYEATHMDAAGLWALAAVNGRISSMLKVGGHTISNLFWNHLLKDYEEVRQFQVVSHEDGSLTLRFRGAGFEQAREAQLRGILNEFLGPVPVAFQWMEQIPLTRAGKLLQVVKE
jgi:phenylacetate-CoA ligase